MSEGTKNTILGVVLAALLAGVGDLIHDQAEEHVHSAKVDTAMLGIKDIMATQQKIMEDIQNRSGYVSPVIEAKLDELRNRLNLHEARLNDLERRK